MKRAPKCRKAKVSFEALCGQSVCSAPAAPSDEMILERIKRHAGWEEEMGLVERLSFLLALPLRPFMALTMASTTWDGLVHPLVPLGLGVFVPFGISGSAGNNLYTKAFGGDSAWPPGVRCLWVRKAYSLLYFKSIYIRKRNNISMIIYHTQDNLHIHYIQYIQYI